MSKSLRDTLNNIEELLGRELQDAPRQLKAVFDKIIQALEKKGDGNNSCGEAENDLQKAQKIIDENKLNEWQAELHALWAYYFYLDCPNRKRDGRNGEQAMWHHIHEAQRLEPTNKRLNQILQMIKSAD